MISVVIPTLNSEAELAATLSALIPAAVEGLVREVVIADGGSSDRTRTVADACGAEFFACQKGRGGQLAAGAKRARAPWLLFLHADTVLTGDWIREASVHMRGVDQGNMPPVAAAFRFKLDDKGMRPRALEMLVAARCRILRLPYGDQGLLISRQHYNETGGFSDLPIMEDVDIVRRLGRARVRLLESCAVTSAERYRRDGYLARSLRNQACLLSYFAGVPAERIAGIYTRETKT